MNTWTCGYVPAGGDILRSWNVHFCTAGKEGLTCKGPS